MKILINCSNLKKGGGLQVANSFINELASDNYNEYYIIVPNYTSEINYFNNTTKYFYIYYHTLQPSLKLLMTGKEKYLDKLLKQVQPKIVFTLFGPSYWKPNILHVVGYAKAQYIYKTSPFFKKISTLKYIKLLIKRLYHLYDFKKRNNAIVTESEFVSTKLKQLFPQKKIFTVENTYNQIFDNEHKWDTSIILPRFEGITLLTIASNYPHKNIDIIPPVINYLKNNYPKFKFRFVLTIKENEFPSKNKYKDYIIYLGKVQINQCPTLYKQSDFMFLPTLLESFSASYPEAMKMSVPILTSNLFFARNICGNAAKYFDPMSPKSIALAIYELSKNFTKRMELIENGKKRLNHFETPKSRANKYIEIIKHIYETTHTKS